MLEEKDEKKQMSIRILNIQHVTLNDMAQPAKLCMTTGTKGGLGQKRHKLVDWNGCLVNKA